MYPWIESTSACKPLPDLKSEDSPYLIGFQLKQWEADSAFA